jgi:hypothetical protein
VKRPSPTSTVATLILCGCLSLAFSALLLAVFGRGEVLELLVGWILACINGVAHAAINRCAVGGQARRFLVWGIVMNALRLAAILATLLAVCFLTELTFAPFAVSLAGGAVVFLTGGALSMAGRDDAGR